MADLSEQIKTAATAPLKASGDAGSVEMQPLDKQIEADRYTKAQSAASKGKLGIRFKKFIPPGAV